MADQQDQIGQASSGGRAELFEEYLAGMRRIAQIRLGNEKYDSIRERADFASLCIAEDAVVRCWALTESLAEALRSHQLDKFITLLGKSGRSP